jgi:hypothetical protein
MAAIPLKLARLPILAETICPLDFVKLCHLYRRNFLLVNH